MWWTRKEVREVCRWAVGPVRATCLVPLLDTVLVRNAAVEQGIGNGVRGRRVARKQIQRLAVCTRNRRG